MMQFPGQIARIYCLKFLGMFVSTLGVVKPRPAGRIRPTDQFNLLRQIPCTSFSSTTFPIVAAVQ